MMDYDEMYANVIRRRNAIRKKKRKRRRIGLCLLWTISCFILISVLVRNLSNPDDSITMQGKDINIADAQDSSKTEKTSISINEGIRNRLETYVTDDTVASVITETEPDDVFVYESEGEDMHILYMDGFYDRCLQYASEEQKKELLSIGDKAETHIREIMSIMGILSEDAKRITVEQAERICSSVNNEKFPQNDEMMDFILGEFNKIAGAPDVDDKSDSRFCCYYLDDKDASGYIRVSADGVTYVDKDKGDEVLLLGFLEN